MTAITETKLEFAKLGSRIGAEIRGLDLSGDLPAETVAQIRAALNEHKALVFREANILSDEAQVKFASHFGPLTKAHPTVASVEGEEERPAGGQRERLGQQLAHRRHVRGQPAAGLHPAQHRPAGVRRRDADRFLRRGLQGPAGELRNFADTLWAIHTNDYDYSVPKNLEHANAEERRKEFTRLKFETAHPVVRVHPLTGERGLFIGGFAQRLRIVGLSNTESRDIIRLLQAYVTRPENVVRVNWEPNQLVLFDNRITQHYATGQLRRPAAQAQPRHHRRGHPGERGRHPEPGAEG